MKCCCCCFCCCCWWWSYPTVEVCWSRFHSNLPCLLNSWAPGKSECDSKNAIFNLVILIGIFRSSHDNALHWMPQDLTDDKLTLVQVMAWCRQATGHYLNQCWLSSVSPSGVARPQWVNWHWVHHTKPMSQPCVCKWHPRIQKELKL